MASTETDEDIVATFDDWCKYHIDVVDELAKAEENLKTLTHQLETVTKTNARLQAECSVCQEIVTQCQQQLHTLTDLEDENRLLKAKLIDKDQILEDEKKKHKDEQQNLTLQYETSSEKKLADLKAEYNQKLLDMETLLESEKQSVTTLESQLSELKKEKEKEINRIILEYESKLTKAQRQKAQFIQQQQQVLNQDVMRKKMQHMKEKYEKDIATLEIQIQELEQKNLLMIKPRQKNESHNSSEHLKRCPWQEQLQYQQARCITQDSAQNHKLKRQKTTRTQNSA